MAECFRRCSETRSARVRAITTCRTGVAAFIGCLAFAGAATPALAAGHSASQKVALIPQAGPLPVQGPNGILPTSAYVSGYPQETFGESFSNMPVAQVTAANLSQYDTAVLNEVHVSSLSTTAKSALAGFVANGGKLLIHDADETGGNDYSWLLHQAPGNVQVGAGCGQSCGSTSGSSAITKNSSLISANPSDPSYVNLGQLYQFTDQGDSNLLTSSNSSAFQSLATGTNGLNEQGAQIAYAAVNQGLIVYNGFDTDFVKTKPTDAWRCNDAKLHFACPPPPAAQPTTDWIAHMWWLELQQNWGQLSTGSGGSGSGSGTGLPATPPVSQVGTPIASAPAGLPSTHICVARKSLYLRLSRFAHMRGRKIIEVDVYVNGRRVVRERRHYKNRTIRHLPTRGHYVVKVVARTSRHYKLIAKSRYHAC